MKIDEEMIKQSYIIAKKVFDKEIRRTDGAKHLNEKYGMNDNTAKGFIENFKRMRNGKQCVWTMNESATKYYLESILNDYGHNALQTALKSVEEHIIYYEGRVSGRLKKIREIYEDFKKIQNQENNLYEYDDEKEEYFVEGKVKKIFVDICERDKEAREKCINHYGYKCFACGLKLADIYGEIADDFIHVHHIIGLSTIKKEYKVDPITDLRPLCPNCHAIIHRKRPALSIEELMDKIHTRKQEAHKRGFFIT